MGNEQNNKFLNSSRKNAKGLCVEKGKEEQKGQLQPKISWDTSS